MSASSVRDAGRRYSNHVALYGVTSLAGRTAALRGQASALLEQGRAGAAAARTGAALTMAIQAERITVTAVTGWAARMSALARGELMPAPETGSRVAGQRPSPGASLAAGCTALSARERELLILVARGRTDAQIAAELCISPRTVSTHLDRIRDKTGCRRRADLTRLALQAGLV
jgi:DNA-binding CsgD family transcriptional regulator